MPINWNRYSRRNVEIDRNSVISPALYLKAGEIYLFEDENSLFHLIIYTVGVAFFEILVCVLPLRRGGF
jgi:hypothetical protein